MTFEESVNQFLEQIKSEIIQNHIRAGQDASGKTIASYEVVETPTGGALIAAPYVFALDTGRGPSKREGGGKVSLMQSIYNWMKFKGISAVPYVTRDGRVQRQESADTGLAYAIARRIHQEGTLAFRNGGTGVISNVITDRRIAAFLGTFAEEYLKEVRSEVLKGFEQVKFKS